MIDWEKIIKEDNPDKLKEVKLWLFQENIRIESEKKDLEEAKEKFFQERSNFRREMDALNRRTVQERQRLKEESLFFDKKMAILQDGFRQLEADRKSFEQKKQAEENKSKSKQNDMYFNGTSESIAKRLFGNINNTLALRKRYKDLIKIFHPDNVYGDEELVQMINKEYIRRKEEL